MQHVLEIEELDARMGKAMRALGEKMRWNQHDWLDSDCEDSETYEVTSVTKRSRAAVARTRIKVEEKEAQAALVRQERAEKRAAEKRQPEVGSR